MKLLITLLLASCSTKELPVLFNRAAPVIEQKKPTVRSMYWKDECIRWNTRPVCFKYEMPRFGVMRCGCCPQGYSNWDCKHLF